MRTRRLGCFVTPHGFGHAARTCAVVEALAERLPLAVELFTTVPEWFFAASLRVPFGYHAVRTDVGLAQRDALDEDLDATVRELDRFLPFAGELVDGLAAAVRERGCEGVLCDVAPLGIAVARAAGVPAALVENFTWDWIYEGYRDRAPGLLPHAAELAHWLIPRPSGVPAARSTTSGLAAGSPLWSAAADLHVQTEPVCRPSAGAVRVPPVARRPRRGRAEVRRELGIEPGQRAVLLTMGGIAWSYAAMIEGGGPRLPAGVVLVVPGGAPEPRTLPWARLLPFHSALYHPDLVAAADAVVGKLGYSTLAECWCAGVPFGFVPRAAFPESPVLAAAVIGARAGVAVAAGALAAASWDWLEDVLAVPRVDGGRPSGNAEAAAAVAAWLDGG